MKTAPILPDKVVRAKRDLAINGARPAFVDPVHVGRPNIGDRETFLRYVGESMDRRWLTNNGPLVEELEAQIARYLGVRHCVATCNGTIALNIAIRALGLSGEVIVPSYTFVATAHALHWQGLVPVFADIDPRTHNVDPAAVERLITPRTSGVIGVHLWGRPAAVQALQTVAERYGLQLLYDAAHAFGCSWGGQMLGGFGKAEVLSFHATKFFNTFEGGAIVTNDDALAAKARLMRNFGFAGYDNVISAGTNGKMTEVCAAMGLANFGALNRIVEGNRRNYHSYRRALEGLANARLIAYDEDECNNYQYVVLEVLPGSPVGRDELVAALEAENVLARKYFWPGCHRMLPYRELYPDADARLFNTNTIAQRVVVLPTGETLSEAAIETIASVVTHIVN